MSLQSKFLCLFFITDFSKCSSSSTTLNKCHTRDLNKCERGRLWYWSRPRISVKRTTYPSFVIVSITTQICHIRLSLQFKNIWQASIFSLWVTAILCKSLDVRKREASQRYLEVLLMEEATVLKTWRIKNKTGRQTHRNRYLLFCIVISFA